MVSVNSRIMIPESISMSKNLSKAGARISVMNTKAGRTSEVKISLPAASVMKPVFRTAKQSLIVVQMSSALSPFTSPCERSITTALPTAWADSRLLKVNVSVGEVRLF